MLLVDCTSSNNHELTQNPIKLRRLNPNENKENIFSSESSWWTKTEEKTNSFVKTTIHAPLRSDLATKENALYEGIENTNNFSESTQNTHTQENYDKRNDTPLKLIVQTMTTWLEDELHHKTPKVLQPEEQICLSEEDFQDITVELGFLDDFCSGASLPQNSQSFVSNDGEITQWPAWIEDKNASLSHQLDNHQIWIDNFSFDGSFPDAEKDTSQQHHLVADRECNSTSQSENIEQEVQEGEYLELLPTMDVQVNLPDACIEESDTDSDNESDTTDEECEMDASFDSELDSSMDLDDHDRRKIEKTRKKNLKLKEKLLALSRNKLREVYRDSRNRRKPLPLIRKIAHQQIQNTLLSVSNRDIHLIRF